MRKLLILLILIIVILAGGYLFFVNRFYYLPQWYRESTTPAEQARALDSLTAVVAPLVEVTPAGGSSSSKNARVAIPNTGKTLQNLKRRWDKGDGLVIDELMLSALLRSAIHRALPPGKTDYLKAVRCDITPTEITVEAVIDTREIPWELLPKEIRRAETLLGQITGGDNSELYLKAVAIPAIRDSVLELGDQATLTVGKVPYPLADLLQLPMLQTHLGMMSALNKIPYKQVDLGDGEMLLRS
jgi:hypothetical protein